MGVPALLCVRGGRSPGERPGCRTSWSTTYDTCPFLDLAGRFTRCPPLDYCLVRAGAPLPGLRAARGARGRTARGARGARGGGRHRVGEALFLRASDRPSTRFRCRVIPGTYPPSFPYVRLSEAELLVRAQRIRPDRPWSRSSARPQPRGIARRIGYRERNLRERSGTGLRVVYPVRYCECVTERNQTDACQAHPPLQDAPCFPSRPSVYRGRLLPGPLLSSP